MQQYFEIHPSRMQRGVILGFHALIAVAVAFHVEPPAMMLGGLALTGLLALRQLKRLPNAETVSLKIDPDAASIELRQGGQPHFFCKYKVYATRWFAILKLIDKRKTRTLILNPECCNSIQSYRRLRYALQSTDRT